MRGVDEVEVEVAVLTMAMRRRSSDEADRRLV